MVPSVSSRPWKLTSAEVILNLTYFSKIKVKLSSNSNLFVLIFPCNRVISEVRKTNIVSVRSKTNQIIPEEIEFYFWGKQDLSPAEYNFLLFCHKQITRRQWHFIMVQSNSWREGNGGCALSRQPLLELGNILKIPRQPCIQTPFRNPQAHGANFKIKKYKMALSIDLLSTNYKCEEEAVYHKWVKPTIW